MRITERTTARSTLAGLQANAQRVAAVQAQLSSGRQITKPSDSPTGTATALQLRGELQRTGQYQSSATDAVGWLNTVDSTMSSITTQVQQVRTLVLQGLNSGSASSTSNEALAQQVDQARASLLSLSNATYLGRPVFGGTTAGSVAYNATTGGYVGDTGTVSRTVAPNTAVQINQTGTDVFGADGSNLFDLLGGIADRLRTDPAALSQDLGSLDAAQSKLSGQQALAGARSARVQDSQTTALSTTIQLKSQLSELQDIDLASTVVEMATANTAYQAALATTAKIRQISLMDYLR